MRKGPRVPSDKGVQCLDNCCSRCLNTARQIVAAALSDGAIGATPSSTAMLSVKTVDVQSSESSKESQMTTDELIARIEMWGRDRGILQNSTAQAQFMKTMSEVGELSDALVKADSAGIKDGVGDVFVTLVLLCKLQGIGIRDCIESAYNEIKCRKGYLNSNGVFVKEEQ